MERSLDRTLSITNGFAKTSSAQAYHVNYDLVLVITPEGDRLS